MTIENLLEVIKYDDIQVKNRYRDWHKSSFNFYYRSSFHHLFAQNEMNNNAHTAPFYGSLDFVRTTRVHPTILISAR